MTTPRRRVAALIGMLAAVAAVSVVAVAPAVAYPAARSFGAPADSPEPTSSSPESTSRTAESTSSKRATSTAAIVPYPGDPVAEAALVAAEERRVIDVRALMSMATRLGVSTGRPYRLDTGRIPTLVLPARDSAYSLEELSELAPRAISRDSDGAYVVSEHVVVGPGATLRLVGRGGMTVRLESNDEGFVALVAAGGSLVIAGEPSAPTTVQSWSTAAGAPDTSTDDGRAYVRVFGGRAEFTNVEFGDLGFWSGLTGGVSLTGTTLPEPIDAAEGGPFETLPDAGSSDPADAIDGFMPLEGDLETLSLEGATDELGYASGLIQSVTLARNAFGLFVTNSDRVEVRDSLIEDSLVDGLVLHRDVTNSTVLSTVARNNARDGFRLTRATSSVIFDRLTADGNGRNGISVESGALVSGPSATGIPTTVYGNNEVSQSTATDNGRYGIEVAGGTNITVRGNTVERNVMGIVVTGGASAVAVLDNEVVDSTSHGISLRDAGLDLEVVGNRVEGARIGVYARNAGGAFERNEIVDVSIHGITLIGDTGASIVVGNAIAGSGPTAVDVVRTSGTAVRDNATEAWQSTKPLAVVLASVFQPLTILWISIGLLLLFGALFTGRRRRGVHDPFADHAPLTSFTRGIVSRDELPSPGRG